jgi:hypothetical protein
MEAIVIGGADTLDGDETSEDGSDAISLSAGGVSGDVKLADRDRGSALGVVSILIRLAVFVLGAGPVGLEVGALPSGAKDTAAPFGVCTPGCLLGEPGRWDARYAPAAVPAPTLFVVILDVVETVDPGPEVENVGIKPGTRSGMPLA